VREGRKKGREGERGKAKGGGGKKHLCFTNFITSCATLKEGRNEERKEFRKE
jgi:hypothetical protein